MEELFKVIHLKKEDKIENLKIQSNSKEKNTKCFPVFMINGKKMIFKPLSKTKPFTTPLFAYSEVYWSYIINKYFDSNCPRYYLATLKGIEEEQPKYYEQGVLIESITPNDEKLISLLDYFKEHPEPQLDFAGYDNYCNVTYYYKKILLSNFIKNNKTIGEGLSYQILLSILRQDSNFHYGNVNLYCNLDEISLAPPIDFEFSTPFLFPENPHRSQLEQEDYNEALIIRNNEEYKGITTKIIFPAKSNVCLIVKMYPDIVQKFIKKLDKLIEDLPHIKINDPENYIGPLNSRYWKIGHAYYKEQNLGKYERLKNEIKLISIDKDSTFERIPSDILKTCKFFSLILKTYLIAHYNGIDNLEQLTIEVLLKKLNITDDVVIEDIDIEAKQLKLRRIEK